MSGNTVYAVASGKGGVGKTTTTVNIGTALAGAGNRVVVVDVDLGMANLAGLISLDPDGKTLHDVLSGDAGVEDALYKVADNIAALPSGGDLAGYAKAEAKGLSGVVESLRERFDYVLLDVGAGVSHESILPLGLADGVVLVTTPEPGSVQDVRKTIQLVERAKGTVHGLVVNRTVADGRVASADIASELGVSYLGEVPEDEAVRDSVYAGTPVVVHASDSAAAEAFRGLAGVLAGTVEPPAEAPDVGGAADAEASDAAAGEAPDADAATEDADAATEPETAEAEPTGDEPETVTEVDGAEPETEHGETTDADATEAEPETADATDADATEAEPEAADATDADTTEAEPEAADGAAEQADAPAEGEGVTVDEAEADDDGPDAVVAPPADGDADAVTIPDAEESADEAAGTDDEEESEEITDEAIPFRGGDDEADGDDESAADAPPEPLDFSDEDEEGDGESAMETVLADEAEAAETEAAEEDGDGGDDEEEGKGGLFSRLFK